MSDFLLAEGFGNLKNGTHTAGTDREILGEQWSAFANHFAIENRGDGRKWLVNSGSALRVGLEANYASVTTLRLAFRVIRNSATAVRLCYVRSPTSVQMGFIQIESTGFVSWYRSAAEATSDTAIPLDTETHVEVVVVMTTDATGSVEFYFNGVAAGGSTGVRTSASGTTTNQSQFFVTNVAGGALPDDWKFGDFVIHTGSSPIGDVGVYYLPAASDGADADFTPSAGADHYAMVDEIGPDVDTTYNESDGTVGHRDGYLTAGISGLTILSVGALARLRKTDTGTSAVKLGVLYSLDESQGAAVGLSEDYGTFVDFFDVNPDTAAAWLAAQIATTAVTVEVQ